MLANILGQGGFTQSKEFSDIKERIDRIRDFYNITTRELFDMLEGDKVPVEIFSTRLAPLESIVKYLKENKMMRIKDIASMLNRDEQTVYHAYNSATRKARSRFAFEANEFSIPLQYLCEKRSIFQSVVIFLARERKLRLSEIARMLKKRQASVWAAYNRGGKDA